MILKFLAYLPAILGTAVVLGFTAINSRGSKSRRLFVLLTIIGLLWTITLFVADTATSETIALWAVRFAIVVSTLLGPTLVVFAQNFPHDTHTRAHTLWAISIPAILLAVLAVSPLMVAQVMITRSGAEITHTSLLYAIDSIAIFIYIAIASYMFVRKRKHVKGAERSQIDLILLAILIVFATNFTTGFVLTVAKMQGLTNLLGAFSILVFSVIVAVAIIRHRLFDIRLVVARALGYLLSLSVVAALYGFVAFGVANLLFGLKLALGGQIALSVATGIAALSFQRLKKFFDKTTNRIFYRDAYDPQELFGQLNRMLVSSLDTKYLMMQSISIIETFLKPDFAVVGLRDGDGQRMFMSRKLGFSAEDILHARHLTPRYHHKVIIADYLEGKKYAELRELMLTNNVAVIVRLAQNLRDPEGGLGYLVLGNKKSGNPYTEQDIRVLDTVANELIIAIQNALHFEEIQNFNATLQAQVDEATRKLRRTNEKLKALDETKDDFISMASHQLRTPLTSVKGYLSMVLEGDAGKVNATQAKMLGQAFISSQRMVYLIADLLNVSRLRTGKFVIEPTKTNLAAMIEEELAQLTETAAARELQLTYDKPKDFPDLMLDETKTRQVIMNFVDNAIYYTPAGGNIKVQLDAQDDAIELRVTDDGIGVPKSEQHHLFTKFYRARNAQKARPDGTGLGLFMAKKVIVGQGGSIIFESAEGQGSTFGFRFSRRKLATNLPQADLSSGQSTTASAERTQKQPA